MKTPWFDHSHISAVSRCQRRSLRGLALVFALFAGTTFGAEMRALPATESTLIANAHRRENLPPRKVLIGTVVSGYTVFTRSLGERFDAVDAYVNAMSERAAKDFPGRDLDLVVLPETLIARTGEGPVQQAIRLEEVRARVGQCAVRHHCYLVAPMILNEGGTPAKISNSAVLFDRLGSVVGIYRKVHAVAPAGSDVIEGGTTPGGEFPVFECDFGRLGIQICFDMVYEDGWSALAQHGAEIVALPSASPESAHPIEHAVQHEYYIVSACPRDRAAVYSPLGVIEAEATAEGAVLVHQVDLSYALVHWDARLEEGEALKRRFGDKVGYHYYRPEDGGLFWSNDPAIPIGRMIQCIGLQNQAAEKARLQRVQDAARAAAAGSTASAR